MKSYLTKDIRNVGIVGHGGTGKTQLVSSLLFTAGATPRWGKAAEGTTTTDWDEEEIARKLSIQTALAHAEWPTTPDTVTHAGGEKVKINFLDLPGYSTFITESKASLIAADAALITVDAHVGAQVTTEKVWDYCMEYDIPRAFVLTWMDRDLASFERSMESLEQVFGRNVVALQLPIGHRTRLPRRDRSGGHESAFLQARWRRQSHHRRNSRRARRRSQRSARKTSGNGRRRRRRIDGRIF